MGRSHDKVTRPAGKDNVAKERAHDQTHEADTWDLWGVFDVRRRDDGDDGQHPPVPGIAVHEDRQGLDKEPERPNEADERVPRLRVSHSRYRPQLQERQVGGPSVGHLRRLPRCRAGLLHLDGDRSVRDPRHARQHSRTRIQRLRQERQLDEQEESE